MALLKGMAFWVVAFLGYGVYSRVKPVYEKWRRARKMNKKRARVVD